MTGQFITCYTHLTSLFCDLLLYILHFKSVPSTQKWFSFTRMHINLLNTVIHSFLLVLCSIFFFLLSFVSLLFNSFKSIQKYINIDFQL